MRKFKRYRVTFAKSKRLDWATEDICLGYSKKELIEFMHPYKRGYILNIEEIPHETTYRLGADDINVDNNRCRKLRFNLYTYKADI